MYATEFQTIVKDPYIQIPEYEKFKNREVRIIILEMATVHAEESINDDFISKMVHTPRHIAPETVFLSRDEANER